MQVNQTLQYYNITLLGAMVSYLFDGGVRKEGQIIKVSGAGYTVKPYGAKGNAQTEITIAAWDVGKLELTVQDAMLAHSNLYQIGTEVSLDYSGLPVNLLSTVDYTVLGAVYCQSDNKFTYLLQKKETPAKRDSNTIRLVSTAL